MGRGLSEQQKAILAAALAVNIENNGGEVKCRVDMSTVTTESYCLHFGSKDCRTVFYRGDPDINTRLALWLALGIPMIGVRQDNGRLYERRAFESASKSDRASLSRAFSRLVERGLIIEFRCPDTSPARDGGPDTYVDDPQRYRLALGYLLTEDGIKAASALPKMFCANLKEGIDLCGRTLGYWDLQRWQHKNPDVLLSPQIHTTPAHPLP